MKKGLDIIGAVTYFVVGHGYKTTEFNYLNMSLYIQPLTGIDLFCVDFAKLGWSFTFYLDPENDLNGIIYNGKKYFGNDLKKFYIEFNNLVNEHALKVLE